MPKHMDPGRGKPGPKAKKISYKPGETIKRLERINSVRSLVVPEVIREEDLKRKAIKLHIRGRDHDYIADRLSVSRDQVHTWIKEKLQQYVRETFDPEEVREIMRQRYDNIMYQALYMAMPHPMVDEFGRPVIGNTCTCELQQGQLCSIEGHTAQAVAKPDPTWAKIYLEILSEQKKMFGVDAADKLKAKVVDTLERKYIGVTQETLDKL